MTDERLDGARPRPLQPADSEGSRALVRHALDGTPYLDRVIELLQAAERGDPETRALVLEHDGAVAALALFGPVAGTQGTWQIDTVLVGPAIQIREGGRTLIDAVVSLARREGARLLVAELPADAALGAALTVLRANRFRQEGRVPDYFRDGVALLLLRRDLSD